MATANSESVPTTAILSFSAGKMTRHLKVSSPHMLIFKFCYLYGAVIARAVCMGHICFLSCVSCCDLTAMFHKRYLKQSKMDCAMVITVRYFNAQSYTLQPFYCIQTTGCTGLFSLELNNAEVIIIMGCFAMCILDCWGQKQFQTAVPSSEDFVNELMVFSIDNCFIQQPQCIRLETGENREVKSKAFNKSQTNLKRQWRKT